MIEVEIRASTKSSRNGPPLYDEKLVGPARLLFSCYDIDWRMWPILAGECGRAHIQDTLFQSFFQLYFRENDKKEKKRERERESLPDFNVRPFLPQGFAFCCISFVCF